MLLAVSNQKSSHTASFLRILHQLRAASGVGGGPSSSLVPQPPLPCPRCLWSQASAAPGQAWALPSASTASDRAFLPPGLPPALACSSCSPGPSWVPPPPGGLPLAFSPWPLTGEQPGPHQSWQKLWETGPTSSLHPVPRAHPGPHRLEPQREGSSSPSWSYGEKNNPHSTSSSLNGFILFCFLNHGRPRRC